MSPLAAVGLLLLSFAAADAARAAPAPSATPALRRAPAVVLSPGAAAHPTATPSPTATSSPTALPSATATPTPTPTPTPTRITIATAQPRQSAPQPLGTPDDQAAAEVSPIDDEFDWHAFVPTDIADHLATMERAARDSGCGVPWQLLAAIARVESDFGRNMATSSAGAIGYGQFLPQSWQAFGSDGNAYDYRDALPAIATYLCQSGLERDPRAALFAYNHADWYVDLVLGLAVRYDRMTSGAPVPDVLDVGPAQLAGKPVRYAAGRDLRLQARARRVTADVRWLGVPWRGRKTGQAVSRDVLWATAVDMLRANFGIDGAPSTGPADGGADMLDSLAGLAWDNGLLPAHSISPCGIEDTRRELASRHPVVAKVSDDQLLVIIGTTADGLIYSDPSFTSTLGYGLELSDADFERNCQRALSFVVKPSERVTHIRSADAPEPIARVLPTATPRLTPTLVPTVEVASEQIAPPVAQATVQQATVQESDTDYSWVVFPVTAAGVAVLLVVRRRRTRPSSSTPGN